MWSEHGLLTVTGGKMTTFDIMAQGAMRALRSRLHTPAPRPPRRVLDPPPDDSRLGDIEPALRLRWLGHYGADAPDVAAAAASNEFAPIEGAVARWAELRWAARAEGVVHLDDLLLRRVRLGLLLPRGGLDLMDRVRSIVQPELGWDDARWMREVADYARLWEQSYSLPFMSASRPAASAPPAPVRGSD
jgi:glycerol-3-phosphate dehydrogenase